MDLIVFESPQHFLCTREHAGAGHYFLQKFKDSGDLLGAGLSAMPDDEMERALSAVREFIPNAQLRGVETNETNS